ncbi:MAG: TolC family protein [Syntrophus sp. (in: bacteria)]|nr:TolC family protein [Syntrophus sp. (in: bacteria)]
MKRALLTFLAVLLSIPQAIVIFSASVRAQERAFALQEIISIGKANNGDLTALREEKGIADAGRTRAGLYANPTLDVEGGTGAWTGSQSENRLAFGISQELLTSGKRGKRLAVADAELQKFANRIADAERLFLQGVKTAFHDLHLAEGRLGLAKQSYVLNDRLFQVTTQRFAAGEIAQLDVNLARVERARSEGMINDAERERLPAHQRLLSLMGLPPSEQLNIALFQQEDQPVADLIRIKALALQKRSDLRFFGAERSKTEAELALARAEQYPNVTIGVGVSREWAKTSLGGMEESNTDTLVGLKLSVPIPLFDRNQAGIEEARARKNSADIRERYLRQNIEREVEGAYARWVAAEKTLKIYAGDVMPQLTENVKLIEAAYRLGEVGISTVIAEQKKFIETSEAYLLALYNRNIAHAMLEAAAGLEWNELNGEIK